MLAACAPAPPSSLSDGTGPWATWPPAQDAEAGEIIPYAPPEDHFGAFGTRTALDGLQRGVSRRIVLAKDEDIESGRLQRPITILAEAVRSERCPDLRFEDEPVGPLFEEVDVGARWAWHYIGAFSYYDLMFHAKGLCVMIGGHSDDESLTKDITSAIVVPNSDPSDVTLPAPPDGWSIALDELEAERPTAGIHASLHEVHLNELNDRGEFGIRLSITIFKGSVSSQFSSGHRANASSNG